MKRGYIQRKPKRRRAVAMRAMAKNKVLGKSAVDKGPARDAGHLAKVRQEECLLCRAILLPPSTPREAHHCRFLVPGYRGRKVSDYLTVPLCVAHHHPDYTDGIHNGHEATNWERFGINPATWIAHFSPEGAAEIARINEQRRAA